MSLCYYKCEIKKEGAGDAIKGKVSRLDYSRGSIPPVLLWIAFYFLVFLSFFPPPSFSPLVFALDLPAAC